MKTLIILATLLASPVMATGGFKIVHPDGTVEFTDDDTRGGEAIELKEIPTYKSQPQPVKAPSSSTTSKEKEKAKAGDGKAKGYQSVTIVSPADGQIVWFDPRGVKVNVVIKPAMQKGHRVILEMDGAEIQKGTKASFSLNNIPLGTHTLHARIEDAAGAIVIDSAPVSFYLRRRTTH